MRRSIESVKEAMDETGRKITKIAREVSKFTVQAMKEEGIGTAEFDFIHLIRHQPGLTQAQVREQLGIDKGAAARRTMSLENKGYLYRKPNPADKRSQLLYATEKAENLKNSKNSKKPLTLSDKALYCNCHLSDIKQIRAFRKFSMR